MMKWDSSFYDQKHSFVTKYGEDLVELLAPQEGERILDIGCGTGHLTNLIAQKGAIVIGLDNSAEMVRAAEASYPNVRFVVADAASFSFDERFDAIFSNAALHWVHRAEQAVASISQALKTGGRLVVEFGGKGNVAQIYTALEETVLEIAHLHVTAQNYFPSIGQYATLLENHRLQVASAVLFDRLTKLGEGEDGLENWIKMFRRGVMEELPEATRPLIIDKVKARLRNSLFRDGVWHADYRRLRIVAYKE